MVGYSASRGRTIVTVLIVAESRRLRALIPKMSKFGLRVLGTSMRWPRPRPTTIRTIEARQRARRPGSDNRCSFLLLLLLISGSLFLSLFLVDGATTTTTTTTTATASNGSSSSSFSSSSAPWQPPARNEDNTADGDPNYEGIVTRFAPGGRVLAVEEAAKAVAGDAWSNTVVAIQCRDGTIVLSTARPSSPYLYTSTSTSTTETTTTTTTMSSKKEKDSDETSSSVLSLWLDGDNNDNHDDDDRNDVQVPVGVPPPTAMAPFLRIPSSQDRSPAIAVTVGNPVSSQLLRHRVVSILNGVMAAGADDSVAQLARRCADRCQLVTQSSASNNNSDVLLPVALLLVDAGSIWRVDPTGQFWQFRALAAGRHAARVEELLVEKLQPACTEVKDGESSDNKKPAFVPHKLKDWIANHLSTKEALRVATECVLEAYRQDARKQALAVGASATTDRTPNKMASALPLRGIVLLSSSPSSRINDANGALRVRSYSGKVLRDMVRAAASVEK